MNRSFPSCPKPLFQRKAKRKVIDLRMTFSFSCKSNSFVQERFCTKPKTWKWPILQVYVIMVFNGVVSQVSCFAVLNS